jgi:hypothetical protein
VVEPQKIPLVMSQDETRLLPVPYFHVMVHAAGRHR